MKLVDGPKYLSRQIKGRHFGPATKIRMCCPSEEADIVVVHLRCITDPSKDCHIATTPAFNTDRTGCISLSKLRVDKDKLPGCTTKQLFYLEYSLQRNGILLDQVRSPNFYLESHGGKVLTSQSPEIDKSIYSAL